MRGAIAIADRPRSAGSAELQARGWSRAVGRQPPLSARQQEVVGLLAEGIRAKAIATRLGLSEATVRNHVRVALQRLGCHSQLEAVAEARCRGLV